MTLSFLQLLSKKEKIIPFWKKNAGSCASRAWSEVVGIGSLLVLLFALCGNGKRMLDLCPHVRRMMMDGKTGAGHLQTSSILFLFVVS